MADFLWFVALVVGIRGGRWLSGLQELLKGSAEQKCPDAAGACGHLYSASHSSTI